jgi:hypothetical protein
METRMASVQDRIIPIILPIVGRVFCPHSDEMSASPKCQPRSSNSFRATDMGRIRRGKPEAAPYRVGIRRSETFFGGDVVSYNCTVFRSRKTQSKIDADFRPTLDR